MLAHDIFTLFLCLRLASSCHLAKLKKSQVNILPSTFELELEESHEAHGLNEIKQNNSLLNLKIT